MTRAKARALRARLNDDHALVLAFLYCNPGATLGDVRTATGVVSSLAVLRHLQRRGNVRKAKRLWSVTSTTAELMAMGSRLHAEGLQAFRPREGGTHA